MPNLEVYETKVKIAPQEPGCYVWKDSAGKILYIGKAINLRNRSGSYFKNYENLDPRIKIMVDQIADVEYYVVDSEVEALILETNLIKKYRPKYNKLMKDDKNYSWVTIDWYNDFPRILTVREKADKKAEYYGPYPMKFPVTQVIRKLRKLFPICDHLPIIKKVDGKYSGFAAKPCFDNHIGLCSGVCAGKVSRGDHRKNVNGIRKFFQGKKMEMIDELKTEMSFYAASQKFERAAEVRDRIKDLEYVTQHIAVDQGIDDEKIEGLKRNLRDKALDELISALNFENLKIQEKFKIECYDISNIQGTNAVGSMVVFVDGKPAKNLYRKFRIRSKQTPDDFAMMRETLTRRLNRYVNSGKGKVKQDLSFDVLPNLMIIDGGKGQLSVVHSVLEEFEMIEKISLVGLAKREEEIFKVIEGEEKEYEMIRLPRRSEALYLVQRVRDETHRFGITYHRSLRTEKAIKSLLDTVPGVGEVIKNKLIRAFGSLDGIRKASDDDLSAIVKNSTTVKGIREILGYTE